MYSYSGRRNVITPLQIMSFYTKPKIQFYTHIHIVVFTAYKIFSIYKFIHHCVFPMHVLLKNSTQPTQYLRWYFDEKRLEVVFSERGILQNMSQRQKHGISRLSQILKTFLINKKSNLQWIFDEKRLDERF